MGNDGKSQNFSSGQRDRIGSFGPGSSSTYPGSDAGKRRERTCDSTIAKGLLERLAGLHHQADESSRGFQKSSSCRNVYEATDCGSIHIRPLATVADTRRPPEGNTAQPPTLRAIAL